MEIRSIRNEAELEQVFDLCDAAFDDTPREFFVASVREDPSWEPWQTRVLVENGQILSSVQIFAREIRFHDAWVPCGGVGNVATHPAARGRGYASLVMQDVLQTLRDREFSLSVLFTGIFSFYARFGYRVLPLEHWDFTRNAGGQDGIRVRSARDEDLAVIRNLHSRDAVRRPVVVRRDKQRWDALDAAPIADQPAWFVAGDSGYLRVAKREGRWEIFELVVQPANASVLDDLLLAAFRHCGTDNLGVDAVDLDGVFAASRFSPARGLTRELMLAVVDEQLALEQAGFGSVEELSGYVDELESTGVSFWRSDFF